MAMHRAAYFSRSSLASRLERVTTVTELSDMAKAAIMGPNRPKSPIAASGIPTTL